MIKKSLKLYWQFLTEKCLVFSVGYFFWFLYENSWLIQTDYHGNYMIAVWIIIGLLFSIPVYIWTNLVKYSVKNIKSAISLAVLWAFIEYVRLFFFAGFPFSTIGGYLAEVPFFYPIIRILGIYGLSVLAVFCSLLVLFFIQSKKLIFICSCVLSIFIVSFLYFIKNGQEEEGDISVVMVQPNLKVEQKTWSNQYLSTFLPIDEQIEHIFEKISHVSKDDRVDLIIFPENAITGSLNEPIIYRETFKKVLQKYSLNLDNNYNLILSQKEIFETIALNFNCDVIFGTTRISNDKKAYNSLVCINNNGEIQYYDKKILVPLGEYLPFSIFRKIAKKYGCVNFFTQGQESSIIVGKKNVLPSVCYEDCFPLFGKDKNLKSDFLVNITNDGWFLPSFLPNVHAKLSKIRAIEMGKTLIRVCENGMSGVIYPDGESKFFEQDSSSIPILKVKIKTQKVVYPFLGQSWLMVSAVLAALCIFFQSLKIKFFQNSLI